MRPTFPLAPSNLRQLTELLDLQKAAGVRAWLTSDKDTTTLHAAGCLEVCPRTGRVRLASSASILNSADTLDCGGTP